jgi:hypothetical protein
MKIPLSILPGALNLPFANSGSTSLFFSPSEVFITK